MIPKEMLRNLGWSDSLLDALEGVAPVPRVVSAVANSVEVTIGGSEWHGTDVNVKSHPPVGSPTLRIEVTREWIPRRATRTGPPVRVAPQTLEVKAKSSSTFSSTSAELCCARK